MKTITLTDEQYEFMKELASNMTTQNNRATAGPYYFVVMIPKRLIGLDANYSTGTTVWIDHQNNEYGPWPTREAWIEEATRSTANNGYGLTPEEAEEHAEESLEEFGYHDYYQEENVFFTEKAYHKHMELNGHNYRSHTDEKVHSYVKYAGRNPEMAELFKVILTIGNQ